MEWTVVLKESALDDLRWFGRRNGRFLLKATLRMLGSDPLADTRQMKTLRPNRIAQRELRLFGEYRILFNVDATARVVTILLAGEKRGDLLIVRGEEFGGHREGDPSL